jgi:hypothetical protein
MTLILLITLALAVSHAFAVLLGNGYTTRIQDARDRHQAAAQRRINEEWRVLREQQDGQ